MSDTTNRKTRVGDIIDGSYPTQIQPTDSLSIDKLYDVMRWYPGFEELAELDAEAIWHNGITDETILSDRLLECEKATEWAIDYGYSVIIVDATIDPPICQAMHPKIKGIGFQYTKFSKMGYPLEIEIMVKTNETTVKPNYIVPAYPCEVREIQIGTDQKGDPIYSTEYIPDKPLPKERGFFSLRTRKGPAGVQGRARYLQLVHPTIWQHKIAEAYVPFAQKMGMWFPFIGLKQNTPSNRESIKAQWTKQPDWDKLMIGDAEDAIAFLGPAAQAFDPSFMLEWINTKIAFKSQMNKLMLTGEFAGQLGPSETAINNWEAKTRKKQSYWRTMFKPVFIALGGSEDTEFKNPLLPTFISLMEGIKAMVEALGPYVTPESLITKVNEYLENNGQEGDLQALPIEIIQNNQNGEDNEGDRKDNQDTSSSQESKS